MKPATPDHMECRCKALVPTHAMVWDALTDTYLCPDCDVREAIGHTEGHTEGETA